MLLNTHCFLQFLQKSPTQRRYNRCERMVESPRHRENIPSLLYR